MRLLFFFAATKDLRTSWMEHFLINQLVDRASRLKYGIHLDQWLGPEHAITKQFLLNIFLDARITNLDKTANIRGVVSDEFLTQIKNIHIPMKPGEPERFDFEYERAGVRNLFWRVSL